MNIQFLGNIINKMDFKKQVFNEYKLFIIIKMGKEANICYNS